MPGPVAKGNDETIVFVARKRCNSQAGGGFRRGRRRTQTERAENFDNGLNAKRVAWVRGDAASLCNALFYAEGVAARCGRRTLPLSQANIRAASLRSTEKPSPANTQYMGRYR